MSRAERCALVERENPTLPLSQQCRLLAVSRSSAYRRPAEVSEADHVIMGLIDRQYLARPYYGSRRMAAWLATQGHVVNRKRGTLGSVRNNSRDWVIDKFEIPLPVTVDSERIRKLVKKIGLEIVGDPELAEFIDVQLKAKLYRIDPGVKVFRCKVQTPPGKQFEVRNEAYRRIEAALKENGIAFADNMPCVTFYQGPAGEPAAAQPLAPDQRAAAK
jgi:hypothetical protein